MKITLSSLALLFVLVSFDFVHASDVTGVYAIIDRVVLEPDEKDPKRVQIWGAFSLAKGRRGQEYREPVRGYLYCSMTEGEEETCRAEWADLKKLAGTGKLVAFGSRYALKAEMRKPTAKVEKPDPYAISVDGIRTVRGNTDYAPIRKVVTLPAPLTPSAGSTVETETVTLVTRNIDFDAKEEEIRYHFEIVDGSGNKEASPKITPGEKQTEWKPKMRIKAGERYVWKVWVTVGDWKGPVADSGFRGKEA